MPKTQNTPFEERVERAMNQRIHLMNYSKNDLSYMFEVQGTTGSTYNVEISNCIKCSCIDFKIRKKICKHIIFIVCKVYKLKIFNDDPNINILSNFDGIDLNNCVMKQKSAGDCAICFDSTDDGKKCNTCIGIFHQECINIWLKINRTCPYCRGLW